MSRLPGFRWTYEHALEKSDLPPLTRWLLNRIAARADARTGMIPTRYMPSVPSLAAATGMSERAVHTHLRLAEQAGWLITEQRPGRKSAFALAIPGAPDVAAAETIGVPADIPPADPAPTPARAAEVPLHEPQTAQTAFAHTNVQTSLPRGSLTDMLADAAPDAPEREIEEAITTIQTRHAQGLIRSERAYLRTLIANGDAAAFIAECSAPRVLAAVGGTAVRQVGYPDEDYHAGWGAPPTRRSEACKGGDHRLCVWSWCECECRHRR